MSGCDMNWSFPNETLRAFTTTGMFLAKTPFFPVDASTAISANLRCLQVAGNFQFSLAVEYAAVRPDNPTIPQTTLGSAINSASTVSRRATLTDGGSNLFARIGYMFSVSAVGASEGYGVVGMDIAVHKCVSLIGSRRIELPPVLPAGANLTDAWIAAISDFLPTAGTPKFKAGIIGRDLQNFADVRTILVYRTATDRAAPGGWQVSEGGTWDTPGSADDERCTGEQTPDVTSAMWVQPGIAIRRHTGGGVISGDFDVSCLLIK